MFFLKVDFEKAFDSLSWTFLESIMAQMGFSNNWRSWIRGCLNSAYASVLVNGSPTPEFKIEKGLRQGDPLSPFLFILAIEALNVVLEEAKVRHFFRGMEVGNDRIYISHLQFADDAIIMGDWSQINVKNLSRILTCFHLASGLKINFNKSKLFGIGVTDNKLSCLASSICCQPSHFPCTYLGLPIGANMSRSANWSPLIDRFHKRLSMWKSKTLSFGGRLTLIKSVLGSLGVYFFSTFKAPKDKVIAPLYQGGLNIGSLKISNQGMLTKWWWRFNTESTSLWCNVIRLIHGPQGGLHNASAIRSKTGPWFQIAKLNGELYELGIDIHSLFKLKIGNGQSTRFWTDKWVGNAPLCNSFPRLFRIDLNPNCYVCDRTPAIVPGPLNATDHATNHVTDASSSRLPNISNALAISSEGPRLMSTLNGSLNPPGLLFQWEWRRPLRPNDISELTDLQSLISNFHNLSNDHDHWECLFDNSRSFTVKGMRYLLTNSSSKSQSSPTRWNKLVPIKVNISIWRTENRRLPTRVNLDNRGIDLDSIRCPVCDNDLETEEHILMKCDIAKSVWNDVLKWWNIRNVQLETLNDLLSLASRTTLSNTLLAVFDAVVNSAVWVLWRFRNDSSFAIKRPNRSLILNDIKQLSFTWISNRLRNI
ncbi:putative RNA-directed DNA polymerase, partial [Tanacetum coccineum]